MIVVMKNKAGEKESTGIGDECCCFLGISWKSSDEVTFEQSPKCSFQGREKSQVWNSQVC